MDEDNKVKCYILASMSNDLQRQHEDIKTTNEMLTHLQELYGEQSRTSHFQISQRLFSVKMHDRQSVNDYCLIMIKDIGELQKLGINMDKELQVDLILQSLSNSYRQFIMNYYMNKIDSTLSELLNMQVTVEGTLKSLKSTVLIVEQTSSKRKSSFKKKKLAKKQRNEAKLKEQILKKADDKKNYFHCNIEGYWRRNYLAYLATVNNRKKDGPSEGTSDLLIIETNLTIFSSSSWVLDFDSSAHLCISMQDLEEVRGLREGEITLRVGNGARVTVAVGT